MDSAIKSMQVRSVVVSRFARVVVESTMVNDQPMAREMKFSVKLPKPAFIAEFKMIVAGKTIHGEVKEKEVAKEQYRRAVAAGRSGGLVSAKVRDAQDFDISTNVPANSSVEFHLVYLELLQRKLGKYDHVILVNPGQVIENFSVEVRILENSGITFMRAILPFEKEHGRQEQVTPSLTTEIVKDSQFGKVCFQASQEEQRSILALPANERKITIRYDVTREVLGGELQIRNGYFVHFFAPKNLPILPKRVVFVIDRSGSMSGTKMKQTQEAFTSVLKELKERDRFNVVTFSTDVDVWKLSWSDNNLLPASKKNIDAAVKYVKEISANGGTNLYEGLESGAKLLESAKRDEPVASMMIMLTDGQANAGISNAYQIRSKIHEMTKGRFSIFCLGFGSDVDEKFLKRLADENCGLYRKIYADSDADLQLKGFFEEVASPLLVSVKISYLGSSVVNTSRVDRDQYFDGSEMVVVGEIAEDAEVLTSSVTAFTTEGEAEYKTTGSELTLSGEEFDFAEDFENFIEKIWGYFTIKELLHKKDVSDPDPTLDKRILELALKYKFVTPFTSMVVTLPEDELPTVPPTTDDDEEEEQCLSHHGYRSASMVRASRSRSQKCPSRGTLDFFPSQQQRRSYEEVVTMGSDSGARYMIDLSDEDDGDMHVPYRIDLSDEDDGDMHVPYRMSNALRCKKKSFVPSMCHYESASRKRASYKLKVASLSATPPSCSTQHPKEASPTSDSWNPLSSIKNFFTSAFAFSRSKSATESSGATNLPIETFCGTLSDPSSELKIPLENSLNHLYRWVISLKPGCWTKFNIEIPDQASVKIVIKKGAEKSIFEFDGEGVLSKEVLIESNNTTVEIVIHNSKGAQVVVKYVQVDPPSGDSDQDDMLVDDAP